MVSNDVLGDGTGWFFEAGQDNDVALASRIRLSRNLQGYPFPGMMKKEEERLLRDEVIEIFDKISKENLYNRFLLSQLSPSQRKILLERNIISQEYSLKSDNAIIFNDSQTLSVLINEIDHLRLTAIHGGGGFQRGYEELDTLDRELEEHMDYAVNFELGYLNTEVTNSGTGLRSSVMLHLPALVESGLIEKTFKAVVQVGLTVKGFFSDAENSLGDMYQISSQTTIGVSEKEIIEKLENITKQIVHYERRAREEMIEKRRVDTEDRIFRAVGILKYCRYLPAREAIELISSLRLGSALGWLKMPIELLTSLLFRTQKSHIQKRISSKEMGADSKYIDYVRAQVVRDTLMSCNI